MITWVSILIIFIVSFLLAIRSSKKELSVPDEIKRIKITERKPVKGVILFLKKKIIHFSPE